ncbi:serpin family protein [Histomonas meleagridis]|uniref:serpin family protein n=1 Tax=Histomonas meleagridis TaxID=135588 RepID=UPI003559DF8A|nr:serpin family protein [Histomonas meleagridis]KAH0800284.1 serpin family protein [Histomonas meleagridis]
MFFWRSSNIPYTEPIEKLSLNMLNLLSNDSENTVVSPYSAFATLIMVSSIFSEPTRKQILHSLNMSERHSVNNLLTSLKNLMETIEQKSSGSIVEGANSLWPNKKQDVDMKVYEPLVKFLKINVTPVEFPQPGCDIINSYVANHTHDLIQNIITTENVPESTENVIVNAIYFNAKWKQPFDDKSTSDEQFTLFDGSNVTTKLMYKRDKFEYGEDSEAKVLSIPYVNDFSMVVILPNNNNIDSFRALKQSLLNGKYQEYIKLLETQNVTVKFPKFEHRWGTQSLRNMLEQIGIRNIFDSKLEEKYVDDVLQQVVIIVDEEKTEAAAVTVTTLKPATYLIPMNPKTFYCDHPFFYFLRHKDGTILFAGEYVHP